MTSMDRGPSFSLGYLGSSPLSQVATGLGMLQKPLRELYIKHRKPGKGTFLPECRVTLTSKGLMMTYREAPETPHIPAREDFYPAENIIMWDTVRFIAVKSTEKKKTVMKSAFEPLDNDHSRNKDNLFSTLDKKYFYLQEQQHPPIFTCVLRRKSGVKALDIHAFFCDSDNEGLEVVRALTVLQNSFQSSQAQETGVFGYTPFGSKSVQGSSSISVGSQQARLAINKEAVTPSRQSVPSLATSGNAPAVASQHNQIPRQNQRQGSTPSQHAITSPIDRGSSGVQQIRQSNKTQQHQCQSNNNKASQSRASSVISHNPNSPFNSSERGGSIGGGSNSGGSQRIYHLSQEDLFSSQLSVASSHQGGLDTYESFPETDEEIGLEDGYQYLPHVSHSLERRQQPVTADKFIPPHFASGGRREDISLKVTNISEPSESSTDFDTENEGPRYVSKSSLDKRASQFSENKPFNYLGGSGVGLKKPVNNSGSNSREGSLKDMGQGYSLLSSSNERPQTMHTESLNNPTAGYDSSAGYEASSGASVDQNRQIFKELLHLQKTQPYQGRPVTNEESTDSQRPMFRPPKSPGYLDKPPSQNKTEEQQSSPDDLETTGSRTSGIVVAAQSQIIEPFKTRNMSDSQQTPQQVKTKPIARVPPHKVTGVRVMPINFDSASVPKRNPSETDALSPGTRNDRPKSGMFLQSPTHPSGNSFDIPPKRTHSQHNLTQDSSDEKSTKSHNFGSNGKQGSAPNWQFGPTKNSSRESSLKSREKQQKQQKDLENNMDDKFGEKLLQSKKKDAEIASVMHNLKLDYKDAPTLTPGAPGGMNFEKSLGYFP